MEDTGILGAAFEQTTELRLGAGTILHSYRSSWGFQFPHLFPKTCLAVGALHIIFWVLSLYQIEYLQMFSPFPWIFSPLLLGFIIVSKLCVGVCLHVLHESSEALSTWCVFTCLA